MDDSVQNSHKSPKGVVGRTISSVMRSLRHLAVRGNYAVLTTMEKPQDENKPALVYPVDLPQKTIDESLSPVTSELMEGLVRAVIRQLLFCVLHVGIAIKINSGSTFISWEDGDALVSLEEGHSPSLQGGYMR